MKKTLHEYVMESEPDSLIREEYWKLQGQLKMWETSNPLQSVEGGERVTIKWDPDAGPHPWTVTHGNAEDATTRIFSSAADVVVFLNEIWADKTKDAVANG